DFHVTGVQTCALPISREATKFYTSIFQDSAIDHVVRLPDTPSGEAELVSFHIGDQPFMAISAGPLFRFNPAISIMVNFAPSRDRSEERRVGKECRCLW